MPDAVVRKAGLDQISSDAVRLAGFCRVETMSDLNAAPPDARIIDIAFDLGFTHLSRMAGAYRAKFGETPSATLRRLH